MIGSGTQADPWVPLTAAELIESLSVLGGYIDLTCDINMGNMPFKTFKAGSQLNLNGFKITITELSVYQLNGYIIPYDSRQISVINGVIELNPSHNGFGYVLLLYGDKTHSIRNLILINKTSYAVYATWSNDVDRKSCVCINITADHEVTNRFSGVYQNNARGGKILKIGDAKPEHLVALDLPADIFYIDNYLGGKNLNIEKKGRSFVSGVTMCGLDAVKMEVTVLGAKSQAKWFGYSDDNGRFTINLGSYSDPVSVFSTDIINKKLRSNNAYSVEDVAIPFPDTGIKFVCIASGSTSELPNPLPTTGTVTLGTAVFEVKNISPSSCAGPMIPANKYSNYGIKSK